MKNKIISIWYDSISKKEKKSSSNKRPTRLEKNISLIDEAIDDYYEKELDTSKKMTKTDLSLLNGKEVQGGLPSLGKKR